MSAYSNALNYNEIRAKKDKMAAYLRKQGTTHPSSMVLEFRATFFAAVDEPTKREEQKICATREIGLACGLQTTAGFIVASFRPR